jgi:hypothetical protein
MANVTFGSYSPSIDEDNDAVDIVFGVFFDGTLNNKVNTKERENNTEIYKKNGIKTWTERQISEKKDTSYDNDWSNVARLSECAEKGYQIYIEGIGTEDYKKDDQFGFAMGSKVAGIRAKVRKGCQEIVRLLPSKMNGKTSINTLTLDVFGFSRGAAAARNFVYEVGKSKYEATADTYKKRKVSVSFYSDSDGEEVSLKELPAKGHLGLKLQEAGITVERIVVRFLGIYDTVSSYDPTVDSVVGMINHDFDNDVEELSLNEITAAKKVVHFIATDEHRENFDLTHTHVGEEKTFPGVHSDIGGSYLNEPEWVREIETSWTFKSNLKPLEDRLVAEGWYNRKQLSYIGGNMYYALTGTRDLVQTYSFIPLKFMTEKANLSKCNQILINKVNQTYDFSKDQLLVRVEKKLRTYVFENGNSYDFKWFTDIDKKYQDDQKNPGYLREVDEQKDLRALRNKYLHWSADRYATGMDPRSDRKRVAH